MKVKFNLFERVAGLFVLGAVVMSVVATVGMGIKKGWFDPKVHLITYVQSADGIHPGTPVRFSGLRIGSVDSVDLLSSNEVVIKFKILKRFVKRINTNSIVYIVRPFVIGEKALEVADGAVEGDPVTEGQILTSQQSPDFLEILGGNKLGAYMESLGSAMQNMQKLAEAFLSNERTDQIIALFDELFPLMEKMNSMATEVSTLSASLNERQRLAKVIDEVQVISNQMNKALPAVAKEMPELKDNIKRLMANFNQLSEDMNEIMPIIKEVAPEMPVATKKAVRTFEEAVITLKAMQKTWFLQSNVEEVQKEEKKLKKIELRQPASKRK